MCRRVVSPSHFVLLYACLDALCRDISRSARVARNLRELHGRPPYSINPSVGSRAAAGHGKLPRFEPHLRVTVLVREPHESFNLVDGGEVGPGEGAFELGVRFAGGRVFAQVQHSCCVVGMNG